MYEPMTVDVNEDATVANITDPDRRQGTDAPRTPPSQRCATKIVPETVGAAPERREPASPD